MSNSQITIDVATTKPTETSPLVSKEIPSIFDEVLVIGKNSIPLIVTYFLQFSGLFINMYSTGHLGSKELAATGLATTFAGVTGHSVVIGFVEALDTLCSQAFTGAKDKRAVGRHLQCGIFVMTFVCIPILLLWWKTEAVMLLLRQDREIAHLCGLFMRYLSLGLWPMMVYECLKRFMQAQGILHLSTMVLTIAVPINFALNVLLVLKGPFVIGYRGAPIATASVNWLILFIMLLVCKYHPSFADCWGGWSSSSLNHWKTFLSLGFPSMLMVCSEWWAYEFITIAASFIGPTYLAAQSILISLASFTYGIAVGLSVSCSVRLGNVLGLGSSEHAIKTAQGALVLGVIVGIVLCLSLVGLKDRSGLIYIDDPDVQTIVSQMIPFIAFIHLYDVSNTVSAGLLRGQGRQKIGGILNLFSFYFVGIPLSIYLTFYNELQLKGLWIGTGTAALVVLSGQLSTLLMTDWKNEVRKCLERVN